MITRIIDFKLDLRLFDETVINKTTSNTTGNDLSPEVRSYYDKNLLENAKPNLVYGQFGMERPIPKNGGQSINFRRFSKLKPATTPLTEGVTPVGSKLNITQITATVKQYGAYYLLSDWLQLTAPDPILTEATKNLGDNAGETLDTIDREALMEGTNVYYGDGSVKVRSGITGTMIASLDGIKNCARILKRNDAKPFAENTYVAIIHPDTWYDLTKEIEDIYKYTESGVKKIYTGELGTYQGIRFVETSRGKIYVKDGAADQDVYATLVLGRNAYGVTSIKGGGIQTIAKQLGSSGTNDPMDQRSSIAWKANRVTKILDELNMIRYEHATTTNVHEEETA